MYRREDCRPKLEQGLQDIHGKIPVGSNGGNEGQGEITRVNLVEINIVAGREGLFSDWGKSRAQPEDGPHLRQLSKVDGSWPILFLPPDKIAFNSTPSWPCNDHHHGSRATPVRQDGLQCARLLGPRTGTPGRQIDPRRSQGTLDAALHPSHIAGHRATHCT